MPIQPNPERRVGIYLKEVCLNDYWFIFTKGESIPKATADEDAVGLERISNMEVNDMNTNQKRLLVTGLLLVTLFVLIKPIRYENPFYLSVIESISTYVEQRLPSHLSSPDTVKNNIAAGAVLLITCFGLYGLRDKHTGIPQNQLAP